MNRPWAPTKLYEVLTPVLRAEPVEPMKEYRLLGIRLEGTGPFHRETIMGSQSAATTFYKVKSGDFIYSRLFACRGAFGVISSDLDGCYVSGEFPTFLADPDKVDINLLKLWFHLPTTIRKVDSECTGSTPLTRNRFKQNFFLNLEIPLPPLEEQRRIVAKINQLASKVEEARDLHERAEWETEALLSLEISHLFSKGREKGWTVGRLGDYVIDDCYGTSEKTTDDISGTPILRMGNIQNGRLDLRDLKYLHLNAKDRTRLLLGKGDIVVNRTNSAELVGKCAVFDLEGEYAFASYLIRLRLDKKRVEPRLVALYINSPTGRAYMFTERKQMTGQANVNARKLKALPIVLPPLPQQHDIVAYLDDLQKKMGELQQLQAHAGAELNALLPSILDKAFKGEL